MAKKVPSRFSLIVIIGAFFCFAWAVSPASSAQAPRRQPTPSEALISPEILSDRKVTFRIYAPKASEVTLRGDWMETTEPAKLAKDEQGIWSVTLGPLTPDFSRHFCY